MARPAKVADLHALAAAMPHVTIVGGNTDRPVYQVGGKSFLFFRTPRPDAVDPITGDRYQDVVVLWVASESDKLALVQADGPCFSTPHFDGHRSVLLRTSRVGEIGYDELAELVQEAWLSQASRRRGDTWLAEHP